MMFIETRSSLMAAILPLKLHWRWNGSAKLVEKILVLLNWKLFGQNVSHLSMRTCCVTRVPDWM